MSLLVGLIITVLIGIGCMGTIIPGLPGIGFVYGGILIYAFADKFTTISVSTVVVFGIITAIASLAQYVGSAWAAKSAGGKKQALIGTFVGALIGTPTGPIGMFMGAFIGALIGAVIEGKKPELAFRVALLSVMGVISGSLIQFFLALALISAFVLAILL